MFVVHWVLTPLIRALCAVGVPMCQTTQFSHQILFLCKHSSDQTELIGVEVMGVCQSREDNNANGFCIKIPFLRRKVAETNRNSEDAEKRSCNTHNLQQEDGEVAALNQIHTLLHAAPRRGSNGHLLSSRAE
jgi:hypothetical protein